MARAADTINTIAQAIDGGVDRIATDAMLCELVETCSLLSIVADELDAGKATDPELAIALDYVKSGSETRAMLHALAALGETRSRFEWAAMACRLEHAILSDDADAAIASAAERLEADDVGRQLAEADAPDAPSGEGAPS